MVKVTAALGKHREYVTQWQPADHRQGGPLAAEVGALHIPVAGRQIAELRPQIFGEVVAAKQGERCGVLARILAKITQIVGDGPASTSPDVPVIDRCRQRPRARQCQSNPNRFQFYVHRVSSSMHGVVGLLPCYVQPPLFIGDKGCLTMLDGKDGERITKWRRDGAECSKNTIKKEAVRPPSYALRACY